MELWKQHLVVVRKTRAPIALNGCGPQRLQILIISEKHLEHIRVKKWIWFSTGYFTKSYNLYLKCIQLLTLSLLTNMYSIV